MWFRLCWRSNRTRRFRFDVLWRHEIGLTGFVTGNNSALPFDG